MSERADQLVLEYVSKVADLAHGVLRTEQRLDFVRRLRVRIEEERRGRDDVATARKVIARFGDPSALVHRELRRLADGGQATGGGGPSPGARAGSAVSPRRAPGPRPGSTARVPPPVPPRVLPPDRAPTVRPVSAEAGTADDFGDSATEVIPVVTDDPPAVVTAPVPVVPREAGPGRSVRPGGRPAPRRPVTPAARRGRAPLSARLRGAAKARAGGRDLRTVLRDGRREVAGMAVLLLAGLLIPFPLPYVAIFPMPLLVWALGAVAVLACEGWGFKDRMTGLLAPVFAYVVGGVVLGAAKTPEAPGEGLAAFVASFMSVSGPMFMAGAAAGVLWLGYRLLVPPPPPSRRPLGTVR
ncbi:hypothetical protein Ssi03_63770 [Sphaerisporangium siamense]|uniref:Uncharacterized protein n=1 Tax=Sphaerisporangium siamense TaxID=795645 RepID=A0A7W7G9C4_9ACTN|nr:hypothetical protein [Sphaerisporangium siamense]MBB4700450.1 hypothetical protein [Sphaerisporangium siamense]GII88387.1 hypothetical protein Ssi03_63770 [Sphaerisporangium siamense]